MLQTQLSLVSDLGERLTGKPANSDDHVCSLQTVILSTGNELDLAMNSKWWLYMCVCIYSEKCEYLRLPQMYKVKQFYQL